MRRGRLVVGVLVLLVVAAALVFYFAFLPGMQVDDYKKAAEPEHAKLAKAMRRLDRTFNPRTFSADRAVKAKSAEEYVSKLRRYVARERRDIRPARRAIRKARAVLKAVDEGALTDVPSWPVIGGSGDLGKAEEVAEDERAYLAASRRFVPRYERLIDAAEAEIDFADETGLAMGNGVSAVPDNPTSPEQIAKPFDSVAAKMDRIARDYGRRKAPRDVRATQRKEVALVRFIARSFREFADAVRARDLPKVESFDERLSKGIDRYKLGGKSIRRLLTKSSYARDLRRLQKLGERVERGLDGL